MMGLAWTWLVLVLVAVQSCHPSTVHGQASNITCPTQVPARMAACKGPTSMAPQSVLVAGNTSQQPWGMCCGYTVPPIKLLETDTSIVDLRSAAQVAALQNASCATGGQPYRTCVDPPSFYQKYTNVYTTDYRVGIPILASGQATDASLDRVRSSINLLFKWVGRIIPNVRQYVGQAYVRVAIKACRESWSAGPFIPTGTDQELGGGSRQRPTTGVEEDGIPSSCTDNARWPADMEEFFHTIHDIAVRDLDPDTYAAITCVAVRGTRDGRYTPDEDHRPMWGMLTPERRLELARASVGNNIVDSLSYEYFVSAAAVWQGLPLDDFAPSQTHPRNISRASIKDALPDLACLLARYFPDVGEQDGELCTMDSSYAEQDQCNMYPGSCYCGNMTMEYLGQPINRTQCSSLREIKENSGNGNASWATEDGHTVNCQGCVRAGCESDKGLTALSAVGSGGDGQTGNGSGAVLTACMSWLLVLFSATAAAALNTIALQF